MKNNKITLRAARKEDAEAIARVITMAIGAEPETFELYPIFVQLAAHDHSQYSYRNSIIAEVDGCVAAAVVAYDGGRLHELREPLYQLMQQQLGKRIEIEEETQAGEYYLDSIAVFAPYRGMGIARMLVDEIGRKAVAANFEHVDLLVDMDNPKAEALYSSMGFERINPTTFLGHKMWHMQKVCVK